MIIIDVINQKISDNGKVLAHILNGRHTFLLSV